jgi:hypothetical protein
LRSAMSAVPPGHSDHDKPLQAEIDFESPTPGGIVLPVDGRPAVRQRAGKRPAKSKLDRLISRTYALAKKFPVMPVEEIRLSVALAELPNPEQVVPRLLTDLVDHVDMHARRVGIHACRRIRLFQFPGLREAIVRRLSDSNGWVRYDAVWARARARVALGSLLAADAVSAP